jgi:hypothetical protein
VAEDEPNKAVFKSAFAFDLMLLVVVELILTVRTVFWLAKRFPVFTETESALPERTKTTIRSSTAPVESWALILTG